MKYTVILPALGAGGGSGDVGVVSAWHKDIGALVQAGDTLALVRPGGDAAAAEVPVVSPAFGILAKKVVLPGEAVEVGEPLAILSGVPEPLLSETSTVPEAFAGSPVYVPGGPEEIVTLDPVAREVARHTARSWRASPRVDTVAAVDMSEVMRLRERVAPGLREREGIDIGILPFVVSAAAGSLSRFPAVNAQLIDDAAEIRRKRYVHVGLSLRTATGSLAVPVLRNADTRSILALAREIDDLTERARTGRLAPVEMRGATFTVTQSAGTAPGILYQTPLLHHPQAAVLSVGAVVKFPVVTDKEQIAVRPVLHLCLSHDARVVDNETAAAFLADVKRGLEEARFLFA